MSAKRCCAESTIKIVFSAEHSFCVSHIVKPSFEALPRMALLKPKVPFWVFQCTCWNPYFCGVWWFCMVTRKCHFPKTDSCNENAHFSLPSEHKCLSIFPPKCHFAKHAFCSQPKTLSFWAFFWNLLFHVFIYLFSFSNIKDKNKKCTFFSKTLFWHPDKLPQTYFCTPTH